MMKLVAAFIASIAVGITVGLFAAIMVLIIMAEVSPGFIMLILVTLGSVWGSFVHAVRRAVELV